MIITKGGGYSLKYIKVCHEFASVVSELIAIIEKSNLIFLIWGMFGSRGTPQLSLRENEMYQKKQRSKSTWSVWCTIICCESRIDTLSFLRLTVFRKFQSSYDLFISYTMLCCICFGHTAPDSHAVSSIRLLIMYSA